MPNGRRPPREPLKKTRAPRTRQKAAVSFRRCDRAHIPSRSRHVRVHRMGERAACRASANWEAVMKAVAFANNDVAVVAWTFGGKLPNCLGFAIYRIDVRAGTETCLPAMATFPDQDATKSGRTTADDPVQKFYWKDVYAKRGGTYRYKIVPMTGTVGSLQPMPYGPLISNQVQLSPHYGSLSAYFNRGILATQATAHVLTDGSPAGSMVDELKAHIIQAGDPLRLDLAGQMLEALTTLSDEAADGGEVFCALYEFQDPEVID